MALNLTQLLRFQWQESMKNPTNPMTIQSRSSNEIAVLSDPQPAANHQLEDGSQHLMKIHYGEKLSDVWSPVANHQLEGTAAVAWQPSSQINFNPFRCGVWRFNLGRGGGRQNEANFYHFTQVPSRPNVIWLWLQHPIHKFRKSKTKVATFPCNIFRQATVGGFMRPPASIRVKR